MSRVEQGIITVVEPHVTDPSQSPFAEKREIAESIGSGSHPEGDDMEPGVAVDLLVQGLQETPKVHVSEPRYSLRTGMRFPPREPSA